MGDLNTDSKVAADDATTVTAEPTKDATPLSSDTDKSVQSRIDGLTAQAGRHKQRAEDAEKKYNELLEQNKSDEDKRVDELVQQRFETEHGGQIQRWNDYEAKLEVKRDKLLESVPDEHRGMIDDGANVEKQIEQIDGVLSLLQIDKKKPAFDGGAQTGATDEPIEFTRAEWEAYTSLAQSDPQEFRKHQAYMQDAYRSGRVEIPGRDSIPNKTAKSEASRSLLRKLG